MDWVLKPNVQVREGTMLRKTRRAIINFLKNEDGPTSIEYAVMLALIIVVCIAAVQLIGESANNSFGMVGDSLADIGEP
jgi:pilus assembly protein Flp/PilA